MTYDTLRKRVSRGASLLDEEVPDWHLRIDPASLNVNSTEHCVLGQLFDPSQLTSALTDGACIANYYVGRLILGLSEVDAADHGFSLHFTDFEYSGGSVKLFSVLDDLWLEAAKARVNASNTLSDAAQ